jgi:hypothetical protein
MFVLFGDVAQECGFAAGWFSSDYYIEHHENITLFYNNSVIV